MSCLLSRGITLLVVALLATACQFNVPTPPAPTPTTAPAAATAEGAAPTATAEPLIIPAATESAGVVHGRIVREVGDAPILGGVELYLAEIIPSDTEVMRVAGLDTNEAPKATLSITGEFVFADVPPGEYAIALVTPVSQMLITDKENGRDLLVTVEANSTVDLGTLPVNVPF